MATTENLNRYARQIQVEQLGALGQEQIRRARIAVVGAGGLGVPAVQYLVGAGLGFIRLIDADVIELSNLHRQPLYAGNLGQPKAQVLQQLMQQLNPEVQIEAVIKPAMPSQFTRLFADIDLVLDCADSYAVSYSLSDFCQQHGLGLISASALQTSGYVGGFCGSAPSLRAVFPQPSANSATCASAGVLGPVVGMLGLVQAQMTLTYFYQTAQTPLAERPLGQLISWNLQGWRASSFRFDAAPEPSEPVYKFIDTHQLHSEDVILELRSASEAPQPIHPQALRYPEAIWHNLPLYMPPSHQRLVLACATGLRSWRAAQHLNSLGYTNLALMAASLA